MASGHFDDKVCVVTGAASGIGSAVSEALLRAGAVVVLADRDADRLASTVDGLDHPPGRLDSAAVDVTSQSQVQELVDSAVSRHGALDFMFNNAGIGGTLPIPDATLEHWRRIIDLNLWLVIYGVHAVPVMRSQGSGHIVNTASLAGLVPFPYQSLHCTTKYVVVGMSECLRDELAADNIRVSVVCPGNVVSRIFSTPLVGEAVEAKPPEDAIPAEEAARIILDGVANGEGIIAFPDAPKQLWRQYCSAPETVEDYLQQVARQRPSAFESGDVSALFQPPQDRREV